MEITIGKIDYNNIGKKNCRVSVDISLEQKTKGLCFSVSGAIWNHIATDIYEGGQILDRILKHFPDNKRLARLVEIWKKYHLNDMNAGTPKQEQALEIINDGSYSENCDYLESIGLLEDNGYVYGSGWLYQELPKSIVKEIKDFMENGL